MSDDVPNKIPVFAIERDDYSPDLMPVGFADNKSQAARVIRRHLATIDGDGDTGIAAESVVYSAPLNAYFIEG